MCSGAPFLCVMASWRTSLFPHCCRNNYSTVIPLLPTILQWLVNNSVRWRCGNYFLLLSDNHGEKCLYLLVGSTGFPQWIACYSWISKLSDFLFIDYSAHYFILVLLKHRLSLWTIISYQRLPIFILLHRVFLQASIVFHVLFHLILESWYCLP